MTHTSIAVIGHVDHGKTALVRALTGVDTDTLAEERARGLTIALGFSHLETPSGVVHLIDTPGHADFLRTTASGLSGVDAVLVAVSAIEGIGAQTREHLKLARLMGIETVIVALTKSELTDRAMMDHQRTEIETLLQELELKASRIVACSAHTDFGMAALASALSARLQLASNRLILPGFFLPIDRVFTSAGAGTIVTGTLIGKSIEPGIRAIVAPSQVDVTIREIQVAGVSVTSVEPGCRVALNLRGVDRASIQKGEVICTSGRFARSHQFDVALHTLTDARLPLKHMDHVMVLRGTGYEPARVRLYPKPSLPSDRHYAQLEFNAPQIGFRGQSCVLRNPATSETLCGGIVIDPNAPLIRREKPMHLKVLEAANQGDPERVARALADRDRGEIQLEDLARLSDTPLSETLNKLETDFHVANDTLAVRRSDAERIAEDYLASLENLHRMRPVRPHHPLSAVRTSLRHVSQAQLDYVEDSLLKSGRLVIGETTVALPDHAPDAAMSTEQHAAYDDAAQRLADMRLRPVQLFDATTRSNAEDDLTELLIANGIAVRLFNHALKQHILIHTDSVDAAIEGLREAFPNGEQFTTGEARTTLKTNRKTIVPLLEFLDQEAVTQRAGNVRSIIN